MWRSGFVVPWVRWEMSTHAYNDNDGGRPARAGRHGGCPEDAGADPAPGPAAVLEDRSRPEPRPRAACAPCAAAGARLHGDDPRLDLRLAQRNDGAALTLGAAAAALAARPREQDRKSVV